MIAQFHSVASGSSEVCVEAVECVAPSRLRAYVVGYSGFRARGDAPIPRRILPLSSATVILDFDDPDGLVTGPRTVAVVQADTGWRHGVAVGLTPAGVAALLSTPIRALSGTDARLRDLIGPRAGGWGERLGEFPDWATRFAALETWLTRALAAAAPVDGPVARAWWPLQHPRGRGSVTRVADRLGITRRGLELAFARQVGMTPGTVARIGRFQHALGRLSVPGTSLATAAATGYADQSHFTRESRALAGVTPRELFAFVQDVRPATAYGAEP